MQRCRNSLLFIVTLLLLLMVSSTGSIAQSKEQKGASGGMVLFAIVGRQFEPPDGPIITTIDPIVIIDKGRYIKPPIEGLPSIRFKDKYFRTGQRYRLFFGGGENGFVTVKKPVDISCSSLAATVRLQSSIKIGGQVMALATNSTSPAPQQSSRRTPTQSERRAVLDLAQKAYLQKGVPASLVKRMETVNLTAIDLNSDSNSELIVSFMIKGKQNAYALLLIAEPSGDSYKIVQRWYRKTESEEEDAYETEHLVDCLDLDNDGTAEIITEFNSYESTIYIIYKAQGEQWKKIYSGGGYGC